jgi:hypothetical protein
MVEGNSVCHIRAFSCLTRRGIRITNTPLSQKPSVILAVGPWTFKKSLDGVQSICLANGLVKRHILVEAGKVGPWTPSGRQLQTTMIDCGLLISWIHCFRTQHFSVCKDTTDILEKSSLRVIDWITQQIVCLGHGQECITLSYVWERNQTSKACQEWPPSYRLFAPELLGLSKI